MSAAEQTPTTAYPPLSAPFTELSHEAEMIALDMNMTPSCLEDYTTQFKQTLDEELVKAMADITASADFCPDVNVLALQQSNVNMIAADGNVQLSFNVDMTTASSSAVNSITSCSLQLGDYLEDFNNWNQPIWTDIGGCPTLQFTSGQFTLTGIAWKCP